MTVETDLTDLAAAHADGATVVDVREPDEYAGGHVPGALNIPLSQVPARTGEVPTDRRVYVVCASGNRSKSATDTLRSVGVDAVSVRGGTRGWVQDGRTVTSGARP
ncbi:rhodanese-like domain-containing protein [Aquipuribacter sp. MA13-6]|uniref:rhodanese-like domain-containing protein n=1 Tax=unclassified Aquipuribacter TaxID=2635084 RepID=UPI003EEC19C1